jgi:hypothetical protein
LGIVKRLLLIRYLLAFLAIAGLVLGPLAPRAAATTMDMPMAMGGPAVNAEVAMPSDCCPKKSIPDCSKDCPFMALCTAAALQTPTASLIVPHVVVSVVFPGHQSDLATIAYAPPRRPPKI